MKGFFKIHHSNMCASCQHYHMVKITYYTTYMQVNMQDSNYKVIIKYKIRKLKKQIINVIKSIITYHIWLGPVTQMPPFLSGPLVWVGQHLLFHHSSGGHLFPVNNNENLANTEHFHI